MGSKTPPSIQVSLKNKPVGKCAGDRAEDRLSHSAETSVIYATRKN